MLSFHDGSHFLIRRIARGRALDRLFQEGHVLADLFLAPAADQVTHVFAHGIKGVRLQSDRAKSASSGFDEC